MTRALDRAFRIAAIAGGLLVAWAAFAYDDRGVSPDLAAWETFALAVAPSGEPGAPRAEFETWASDDDLFAASPPRWPSEGPTRSNAECRQTFDRAAAAAVDFPADACIREDVRRNWAAFHYLVSHDLTSKAGLAGAFARSLKIDLPADAVQVKADWMKVGDLARWLRLDKSEIRRTYYTEVAREGETEYALVGLHVNAKRWKNWLWATFENRLNPGRCDKIGCHDSFGAAIAHVLSRDPPNQNFGECEKTPALVAMFADAVPFELSPNWNRASERARGPCRRGSREMPSCQAMPRRSSWFWRK